jgi:hypothetical protein
MAVTKENDMTPKIDGFFSTLSTVTDNHRHRNAYNRTMTCTEGTIEIETKTY